MNTDEVTIGEVLAKKSYKSVYDGKIDARVVSMSRARDLESVIGLLLRYDWVTKVEPYTVNHYAGSNIGKKVLHLSITTVEILDTKNAVRIIEQFPMLHYVHTKRTNVPVDPIEALNLKSTYE